jgi:hypothetical protein
VGQSHCPGATQGKRRRETHVFTKPRFGMRLRRGVCPPSNAMCGLFPEPFSVSHGQASRQTHSGTRSTHRCALSGLCGPS